MKKLLLLTCVSLLATVTAAPAQYDPWGRYQLGPPGPHGTYGDPMGRPQGPMPPGLYRGYPIWAYPGGNRGAFRDGGDLYLYRRYYEPRPYDPYIWPPPGFR